MGFVCTEEGGAKTAFFFIREGLWGRDWLCYRLGPRSVKVVFCMGGGARAAMWIVIGSCLGGWADRLQERVPHWGHDLLGPGSGRLLSLSL